MDTMEDTKRAARRRHDPELKSLVLEQCKQPGASVARIALSHGLNTNLVHNWRREARGCEAPVAARSEFIPVQLATSAPAARHEVRIELRRGAIAVNVDWPLSAMPECAAWLREILR